jgi:chaperonin cofactor prefoldin
MSDKKHSLSRTLFGGLFSIAILGIATFILLNQQYVKDQVTVWSYKPTSNIQALEKNIDFTDKGKFNFYAQQPEVDGSDAFNKNCQRQEVGNPILGCYLSSRIYVFDVTNTQLDGIEEVTAAHETLHAVWERMSDGDRAHVSTLLEAEYAKLGDNTDLTQRMDYYKRAEPGQFDNELHSILGTEIPNLGPELEAHYKEYFNDRQKIVDYHTKYAAVFTGLKSQSDSLYNELTTLGSSIESRSKQYDTDVKQLSADISAFNTRADNGDFSSINQFKSERAALLARSNQLDADRASISADIDTYNAKYAQYQKVSSEIEALNKSIDSIKDLQPAPSV